MTEAELAPIGETAATFDDVGLGHAVADLDGRYLRVNRRLCEMLGYSEGELLATTFHEVAHEDDPGVDPVAIRRLFAGEIRWFRLRKCYRRADGTPLWARVTVSLRRDSAGLPLHYLNVVDDATRLIDAERDRDRFLAEEATARTEADALAALITAARSAVGLQATIEIALAATRRVIPDLTICNLAMPDDDGLLRFRSGMKADVRTSGRYSFRSGEGLVGRAFAEGCLQHTDDLLDDERSHQRNFDQELRLRAYAAAPLIANGRTLGVLTAGVRRVAGLSRRQLELLQRIADHVAIAIAGEQTRVALRDEAAQKTAVIDQMADGLVVVDRSRRIVLANAGAMSRRDIGVKPDLSGWLLDGVDPAERRRTIALLDDALAGVQRREELLVGTGTTARWLEVTTAPMRDAAGTVIGAILVARDVSDQRRAVEAAAEARALAAEAERLRAVGQMASGVAHNVNQSLALIATSAELAAGAARAQPADWVAVAARVAAISRAALDGGETVTRLLTFARGRGAGGPTAAVEVRALLREVSERTAPRWNDPARVASHAIVLTVDAPAGLHVIGRAADLVEALVNLVFNAVDAMPRGGQIELTARAVDDRVEILVSDDGPGMPDDVRARAFEPFVSTKGERGTGLGLAMVFAIVEQHGGTIDLRTALGEGTRFTIRLPAARPASTRRAAGGHVVVRARRVLVVDDDELMREAVAGLLRRDGHEVVLCASGEEALDLLGQGAVDVVLSDLAMGPTMNGWELAQRVKERWSELRFVLCTGLGRDLDVAEAHARGVDAVLPKPYRTAELRRAIGD